MNREEAIQVDMVDYLNSIGYQPQKIRGYDYWYLSPFRNEKVPSFKIQRNKNVWYDHGYGKGGRLPEFVQEYYHCDRREALQRIAFFQPGLISSDRIASPPFHLQKSLFNRRDIPPTAIRILAAKQPVEDLLLCRYLKQRRIAGNIADKYCYEVEFTNGKKERLFRAIGFKNNAGGYELRNEYFKGSSSPKYITYLDNKTDNVSVFEGFFDFMSFQTLHQNQHQELSSFLILNSLSFFEKSLLLMEKHDSIHLYLDQDPAGKKWTSLALKRAASFKDESKLYRGYKDLNDWMVNFGKKQPPKDVKPVQQHF